MAMEKKMVDKISLPPGFRFHPTDEELILHYLRKKVAKIHLPTSIVNDIELYRYDPWDLPKESTFGDDEWYFFTPRDRKYPNGMRPNRMVASGYWKATGIDKPILSSSSSSCEESKVVGVKKALVFYTGRPPKGNKTNWIMLEYRLPDLEVPWPLKREKSMRLDDWVLCRIRQKAGMPCNTWEERKTLVRPTPTIKELPLQVQYLPAEHENQEAFNHNNIKGEAEMVREYVQKNTNNTMQPFSFHMPKSDDLQRIHDMGKRKHGMELGSYDQNKKPNFMINADIDQKMETSTPSYDVALSGPALVVYQDIYSLAFADREIFLENDI